MSLPEPQPRQKTWSAAGILEAVEKKERKKATRDGRDDDP